MCSSDLVYVTGYNENKGLRLQIPDDEATANPRKFPFRETKQFDTYRLTFHNLTERQDVGGPRDQALHTIQPVKPIVSTTVKGIPSSLTTLTVSRNQEKTKLCLGCPRLDLRQFCADAKQVLQDSFKFLCELHSIEGLTEDDSGDLMVALHNLAVNVEFMTLELRFTDSDAADRKSVV